MKCLIIPLVTGAIKIVKKASRKNCKSFQGKSNNIYSKDSYTWNITHNTESIAG
jgi:hypothetical protein